MHTKQVSSIAHVKVSNNTSTSQNPHTQVAQPSGQPRTSRYTTGILTTSGWTPLANSSWHVLRTEVSQTNNTAGDDEVEEIFKCHEEGFVPQPATAKTSSESSGDESNNNRTHATATMEPDEYLDYNSYFLHVGWTGCASLEQDNNTSAEALATLPQRKPTEDPSSATVNATSKVKITLPTGSQHQHSLATMTKSTHRANVAGSDEQTVGQDHLPVRKAKQVKAYFHPEEDA